MKRKACFLLVFSLALWIAGCQSPPPASPSEVVVVEAPASPGLDDPIWGSAPVHVAPLLLQDIVEPRLTKPSTSAVSVQAASDGTELTVRLQWDDPTRDDLPGIGRFSDACALQLPAVIGPDAPAPQMGEEGKAVEIVYWSAAWQAAVDGRPDAIQELYPGATVDHYPFEAPSLDAESPERKQLSALYSPARALGNDIGTTRTSAVQDLLAAGPGTLRPAPESRSRGAGRRTETGWAVTLTRPMPEGWAPGQRAQVAFAVWQGDQGEVGARKMRSGWIPIYREKKR